MNDYWLPTCFHISLPQSTSSTVWVNESGCYRCPLQLLSTLFAAAGSLSSIIPYCAILNLSRERTYPTPWDTKVYEGYTNSINKEAVLLVDFYSDGTTLTKSGTQSATFYRVRFSNLQNCSETLHTVGISPTMKTIPLSLSKNTASSCSLFIGSSSRYFAIWSELPIQVHWSTVSCSFLASPCLYSISPSSAPCCALKGMILTWTALCAVSHPWCLPDTLPHRLHRHQLHNPVKMIVLLWLLHVFVFRIVIQTDSCIQSYMKNVTSVLLWKSNSR